MITFLIVLVVLYFTGLLPFVFAIVMFIAEMAFTAFILVMGFVVFMIGYPISLLKSKSKSK